MTMSTLSAMEAQNERLLVPFLPTVTFRKLSAAYPNFLCEKPSGGGSGAQDNGQPQQSSPAYRYSVCGDAAYAALEACYHKETFLTNFRALVAARGDQAVVGYRPVERVVKEEVVNPQTGDATTHSITYLRPTVKLSYNEVWDSIECFGLGLESLGVKPGRNVAIFQETCVEWFVAIYGIWNARMIAATVYANLGTSALTYALHQTESAAIICGGGNAARVIQLMAAGVIPEVPIVHVGALPTSTDTDGVTLHEFRAVVEKGRALREKERTQNMSADRAPTIPHGDDLALIMYTSGTTGDPKGVMHSHGGLSAGMRMLATRFTDVLGVPGEGGEEEVYYSYLPLAHIMEFTVTNLFIQRGALIGFGSPRTLTDATARPHGDLTEYRPQLIVGVPRIFDTLKKGIESKLPPPGSLKRDIFDHAYASRLQSLKEGFDTPFWNEKVFKAARDALGGRVRACLCGGGPISASTQEFVNVVLAPCVHGIGMTETVCVGFIQHIGDWRTSCVGCCEPGEEFKLLDTEHYKHTDTPEPRGELCYRGVYLFKGYYKQPELTKEVIDEDGWFHSGDVGSITEDGQLRIIGRVKALAKNSLGEYIAMELLESIYSGNALVQPNGVCVLVHPDKNYVAAVALTDEDKAMAFAKANNIEGTWPSILDKAEFQEAAARSLAQTAKDANRAPFECVRHVRVVNDEWTPENDVLTAGLKLKRRVIDKRYESVIRELFADP